jgi:accessory secretory protein Asp1
VKFLVEQCVDEIDVTGCMRKQRVILDLRPMPELYLQVTAISLGVPQIVLRETQFVEDGNNGFVLQDISDAGDKISYYLDNLSNWNEAVINSYELGRKFTTQVLINRWKEVLKAIE